MEKQQQQPGKASMEAVASGHRKVKEEGDGVMLSEICFILGKMTTTM